MSESRPPNLPPRRKLAVERPIGAGGFGRQAAILLYAFLAVALAGVGFYMAIIEERPLVSGWVAAPSIGAVWFGLRLFMILGSRK